MQKLVSNKFSRSFSFDIAKGDLGGGAIGNYATPIDIPVGALVRHIIVLVTTSFVSAGGGGIAFGTSLTPALFTAGTFYDFVGDPVGVANDYAYQTGEFFIMDATGRLNMAIDDFAYTEGAGKVYIDYYYPQ